MQVTVSPKPSLDPSRGGVTVRVSPHFRSRATTRLLLSYRSRNLGERNISVANRFELVEGVLLEQVGGDLLVAVPGSLETLRLTGDVANTLRAIHSGVAVDFVGSDITDLIKLGVVADRSKVSRRGVVRAGVVGVGAGIAVLAMPSVAAASSNPEAGDGSDGGDNEPEPETVFPLTLDTDPRFVEGIPSNRFNAVLGFDVGEALPVIQSASITDKDGAVLDDSLILWQYTGVYDSQTGWFAFDYLGNPRGTLPSGTARIELVFTLSNQRYTAVYPPPAQ
jgi:hypothetical protein